MTRRLLLPLFGLVGALLMALIGYEIFAPSDDGDTDTAAATPGAAAQAPVAPAVPPMRNGANNQEVAAWVAGIVARPLFSASRRPDPAPNAPAQGPADDASKEIPRLSGVLVVANARHAMFQPPGDTPPLVVAEGETVAGWRVVKINLQSVTLNGPGGETVLEPKFDETMIPPPPAQAPFVGKPPVRGQPAQPPQPQPAQPPQLNPRGGAPVLNPGTPIRPPQPGQPAGQPPRPPNAQQPRAGNLPN